MLFRQLFDLESSTYTYLIADPNVRQAVLVDPVFEQADRDLQLLREIGLELRFCLETHIHADHITGAARLRALTGCTVVVPEHAQAAGADRFICDGEVVQLGSVAVEAIATPGHTNSHTAYLINNERILTGDALFIRGCGRTDFQGGDAGALYDSVTRRLFALPDETLVYPGHDYKGQTVSSIGEEKRCNPRFQRERSDFIGLMTGLGLPKPKKLFEAVPANLRCGAVA